MAAHDPKVWRVVRHDRKVRCDMQYGHERMAGWLARNAEEEWGLELPGWPGCDIRLCRALWATAVKLSNFKLSSFGGGGAPPPKV